MHHYLIASPLANRPIRNLSSLKFKLKVVSSGDRKEVLSGIGVGGVHYSEVRLMGFLGTSYIKMIFENL